MKNLLNYFRRPSTAIVRGSVQSDFEQIFKAAALNRHMPHRKPFLQNMVANFKTKWNLADNDQHVARINQMLNTYPPACD